MLTFVILLAIMMFIQPSSCISLSQEQKNQVRAEIDAALYQKMKQGHESEQKTHQKSQYVEAIKHFG